MYEILFRIISRQRKVTGTTGTKIRIRFWTNAFMSGSAAWERFHRQAKPSEMKVQIDWEVTHGKQRNGRSGDFSGERLLGREVLEKFDSEEEYGVVYIDG